MRRREVVTGLAGVAAVSVLSGPLRDSRTISDPEADVPTIAASGSPATICAAEPKADPGIYAIDEPAFATDWGGYDVGDRYANDGRLGEEWTVIGLERGDRGRAYPVPVLWYHEIVNDEFGGPVLITYCQICRSGLVTRRLVDGAPTRFEVSGQLWEPPREYTSASVANDRVIGVSERDGESVRVLNSGNLVLVDEATGSFWSQLLGQAICGPAAGDRLSVLPTTITTWEDWRATHPDGEVLLPPPHSGTVE